MEEKRTEIWIAEDNEDVRLMLARAFKRLGAGLRIQFFGDGAALLHYARNSPPPRLILLDVQMPVLDGVETIKRLRTDGLTQYAPVLMFSASEDPKFVREAYQLGARMFLRKPMELEGYAKIVKLCAGYAEAIQNLPSIALPFGILEVDRAFELLAAREVLKLSHGGVKINEARP